MVNFLKDPSGDLPWEEDERGKDILHIPDAGVRIFFISNHSNLHLSSTLNFTILVLL